LACTETWKDKDGSKQEKCVWINCVLFKKLSEIAEKYVEKGMTLYVEGSLSNNQWKDKDGKDRTTTQIIVEEMQMLGGKGEKKEPSKADAEPAKVKQPGSLGFDDDIPF
jgi:single-strand DNA-binding protein